MRVAFFYLCAVLATAKSSKCPEAKKPHPSSCTVFYNCINLPSGGYVWVPTKCTDGLVFEPYLRICVLPGDSWSCDASSTEGSLITKRYETPELIDPNETSYIGFTEDPQFSEPVDSSYTTDDDSEGLSQETVTPYPLIEIDEDAKNKGDASILNTDGKKEDSGSKSMLDRLINHLLVYKEITIPLEFFVSSKIPTATRTSTSTSAPESVESIALLKNERYNVLLNYLIQNYIQQNNLQNTIVTSAKLENAPEEQKEKLADPAGTTASSTECAKGALDLSNDREAENDIILINDNVGNRQYLTVEKFKSLSHQLNSQYARRLPCVKNIRLPNSTDCSRYYTCEPETASVKEYSCPLNTAFNKYSRICDTDSRDACIADNSNDEVSAVEQDLESGHDRTDLKTRMKKLCPELGKMKDPYSDSHYYICYTSPGTNADVMPLRLTCPNSLIFCRSKKVCTTRRLCKA